MQHCQQVPYRVVRVGLDVRTHRLAVTRVWTSGTKGVVIRDLVGGVQDIPMLSEMLTAGSANQTVNGIVRIVAGWLDAPVLEVDSLLRVVTDVGDVTGGVISIPKVLHLATRPI